MPRLRLTFHPRALRPWIHNWAVVGPVLVRRVELRLEPDAPEAAELPDYHDLLRVPDLDAADGWGWVWSPDDGVEPAE